MNWPDPGSSSPPDDADGASPPDRTPAADPDPAQGREPTASGDDAVWLSSDDLASSPRPWEDRDPSQLAGDEPDETPQDAPGVAGAGEPLETPTYAQLRSEADRQRGRWERTADDGSVVDRPPGADDVTGDEDHEDGTPADADVAGEHADPDGADVDAEVRPDATPDGGEAERSPAPTGEDPLSAPLSTHEGPGFGPAAGTPDAASWDAPSVVPEGPTAGSAGAGAGDAPAAPHAPGPSAPPEGDATGPAGSGASLEQPTVAPHGDLGDEGRTEPAGGEAFHGEHPDAPEGPFHGERPAAVAAVPEDAPFHGEQPGAGDQPPRSAAASVIEDALSGLETANRSATVICVANQKGGVGKTTTTVSLGAALAMAGAQVLVVDLDPQGNATTGLGLRAQEGAPSTYRVIVEQMDVEDAAEPTAVRGLHVLPSSLDLAGAEIELVPAFSRENRLKQALDAVRDLYDVILIDCPPSLGLLTINALVAADQVLVPIQCEYYALEGLGQLMRTVKLVADSLNRGLAVGGVVLTMFDGRTNLSQQVADEVRGYFGDIAYQTIVPRTVRLSEAPSYGQPIGVFDAASRGARAYQRLAREVARRLELELETEEVSPLDRLLGSTTPSAPDEVTPLPTDLAPEDVPSVAETPAGEPAVAVQQEAPAQHDEHHHGEHQDEHHHGGDDQSVPGTEGQP